MAEKKQVVPAAPKKGVKQDKPGITRQTKEDKTASAEKTK